MRRWLALTAVATTSIVVLAFLIPLAALISDLAKDRALASAEREAQAVAQLAATVDDLTSQLPGFQAALPPGVSVALPSGQTLGQDLPAEVDVTRAASLGAAFHQVTDSGQAVVVPVLKSDGPWIVVVSVPKADLRENVIASWLVLGALGLALVALAALVADRLARAVVQPIEDLVEATHRLGMGDLQTSVVPSGPHELVEVGSAFNTLSSRVQELLDRERESSADLSHRLRTPLTALKLDVEALGTDVDATRILDDVDELERTISHVINEARRPIREGVGATTDLVTVVADRTDYWGVLADDQNRNWTTEISVGPFNVRGRTGDFEAALDAIIGNIFAHTPPGTPYAVTLITSSDIGRITVADQGPGFADPALLERGMSSGDSTGLGIDIVRNTVEAAGGSVTWSSPPTGGTTVEIEIPQV